MPKRIRLDPASTVLRALGGERGGVGVASRITGRNRSQVWRWTQPKENGGTGGVIPKKPHRVLLTWAKKNRKRGKAKILAALQ